MYRYIILLWDRRDPEKSQIAQMLVERLKKQTSGWRSVLQADGAAVFDNGGRNNAWQAYVLPDSRGVVLGKLFTGTTNKNTWSHVAEFGVSEARELLETRGKHLIDEYWGRYVAVFLTPKTNNQYILRDPTGGIECLHFTYKSINVFCSDLENVFADDIEASFNWRHIASILINGELVGKETGLTAVTQVQAGECLEIDGCCKKSEFYWSPQKIFNHRRIDDAGVASELIRQTTLSCVQAWASCYSSIIHDLSGGLDSSIVLACLSEASSSPDVLVVNRYSEAPGGDEREFARKMVGRTNFEYVEKEKLIPHMGLSQLLESPRSARPGLNGVNIERDLESIEMARKRGADAFFTGQGGDSFFFQMKAPSIAADYLQTHGLGAELINVARDVGYLTSKPAWLVLWRAIQLGWLSDGKDYMNGFQYIPTFVGEACHQLVHAGEFNHPWVRDASGVPPAKRLHFRSIVNSQQYYAPSLRGSIADVMHPLLSQPLIELCVSIPTYVLTQGGMDRALARNAFREYLPKEICNRRTKGDMMSLYNNTVLENLPALKELLLDGLLVQERILDRPKLEEVLTEESLLRTPDYTRIMMVADIEAWLTSWSSNRQKKAA